MSYNLSLDLYLKNIFVLFLEPCYFRDALWSQLYSFVAYILAVMWDKVFQNWCYNTVPRRLHLVLFKHNGLVLCFSCTIFFLYYCIFRTDFSLAPCVLFRCDLSQGEWVRCNVDIQKICHYPVFGLKEGTLYQFRVRSVNQAGAGRPSKATKPVVTADPLEHTRTMGNTLNINTDI